jgi:hypothetical protein
MIEMQFRTPRRRHGELEWELVATIRVDGTSFELEGDDAFAEVRDIEVVDLETGQSVKFDADPERWARNLPHAFRNGDLVCDVIDDGAVEVSAREALTTGA